MSKTLYATFVNVDDAERAAGAIMDHGVVAQDISFIVPERAQVDMPLRPDYEHGAVPPGPGSVNSFQTTDRILDTNVNGRFDETDLPLTEVEAAQPGYRYDALGAPIMDSTVAPYPTVTPYPLAESTITPYPAVAPAAVAERTYSMAAVPGDTPLETMEHEARPHIVDMNRNMPNAASGISTTTGRDAAKGAVEGAGIGVGLGLIIGLAAIAIPGVGLVAGAGLLAAGLAAATGVAGGIAGGAFGYLKDLGVPEDAARNLDSNLAAGGPVLSVTVTDAIPETEIVQLLRKYNATSVEAF